MPQKPLPFFEQREQDELAQLLLQRAWADQAREGAAARVLQFWIGRGARVEFAVLLVIQPADQIGATCHRALAQQAQRTIERSYKAKVEVLPEVERRLP